MAFERKPSFGAAEDKAIPRNSREDGAILGNSRAVVGSGGNQ